MVPFNYCIKGEGKKKKVASVNSPRNKDILI